jgi:hypothetical protein
LNPDTPRDDQEMDGATDKDNEPTDKVMITAKITVGMLAARRKAPGPAPDIADLLRTLAKALFDPYRPELHYMRGPGPKWHAKHDLPGAPEVVAMPAMIRCA